MTMCVYTINTAYRYDVSIHLRHLSVLPTVMFRALRRISVVVSDIQAQSEVAAVQCVISRRLNITVLLLLCN